MTTNTLPDVTIRLDAAYDLRAAGRPADEASVDSFVAAYRQAAADICDGYCSVRVIEVTGGADIGCDAEWANEFGLWQAVHDCVLWTGNDPRLPRWTVSDRSIGRVRSGVALCQLRQGKDC